jgi:hypothetical protein
MERDMAPSCLSEYVTPSFVTTSVAVGINSNQIDVTSANLGEAYVVGLAVQVVGH